MFQTSKPKLFSAPGVKPPNSRSNFVNALNQSFDTAEKLLHKSGKLKQTKLCLMKLAKKPKLEQKAHCSSTDLTQDNKSQFFKLPVEPQIRKENGTNLNRTISVMHCEQHTNNSADMEAVNGTRQSNNAPMQKNGRSKLALLGQVDFCLKMHKVHPDIEALWAVYGKLHKILKGKQRGEHILLLRSMNGGPILQSIYYDFADTLKDFELGSYLRVVGHFMSENRLRTFKMEKITNFDEEQWKQYFTRIQNVTSFVLLQNNIQKKTK